MSTRKRISSESAEDEMLPGTSSESAEDEKLPGTSLESAEDEMLPGTSSESAEDEKLPGTSSESTEDDLLPGTSNGPPSRDEIYEDIGMSLVCLPQVPMRQILQYLNINDKRNLRLTSWSLKDIVDNELVKICTFNTAKNDINNFDPNMLASDCDINFEYSKAANSEPDDYEFVTKVVSTIDHISDRVVKISGPSEFYMKLDDKMTSFSNVKDITIQRSQLPSMLLFPNLKILELSDVKTENFEDGKFMLNQLEELHLYNDDCSKGLKALLSACRNIRYIHILNSVMSDVLTADFNMPNLKKLILDSCSPEFLYIVTGSASTLTVVGLRNINPEILTTSDIQIPNLSQLSLVCVSNGYAESLRDLIAKFASSVQELNLSVLFPVFQGSSPDFPKLDIFRCDTLPMEEVIKVIKHSPNLKHVQYGHDTYPVTQPTDQPSATYLFANDRSEVDVEKFQQALNNPSRSTEELLFIKLSLDLPDFNNIVLTRLLLLNCDITSGFENLLSKCSYTLEELILQDSHFGTVGTVSEFKVLRNLSVVHKSSIPKDTRFTASLTKLLMACRNYLEKLTLEFLEDFEIDICEILQQVKLTNLKIFRVYPRPEEKELSAILEQLPDDVTLWPILSLKYRILHQQVLELMKVLYPNVSHVDVSK